VKNSPAPQSRREFLKSSFCVAALVSPLFLRGLTARASNDCPPRGYGAGPYGRGCFSGRSVRLSTGIQSVAAIRQKGFRFLISGAPGQTVVIEASSDLTVWSEIQTRQILSSDASVEVFDLNAANAPHRFYRARNP